jgi:hypothetical protein
MMADWRSGVLTLCVFDRDVFYMTIVLPLNFTPACIVQMQTLMTVSEIHEIREKVRRKLSHLPEFVLYELLTTMLTSARDESARNGRDTHGMEIAAEPSTRSYFLTSPDQKEKLIGACEDYFRLAENSPTTMRRLAVFVQEQGIEIPGKNPGTTLGAILAHHPVFEICDKQNRLWRLKAMAYNGSASNGAVLHLNCVETTATVITTASSEASAEAGEVGANNDAELE